MYGRPPNGAQYGPQPQHHPHQARSCDSPPPPPHANRPPSGYGQKYSDGALPPPSARLQQYHRGGGGGDQLQAWFNAVDTDRSGQITEVELKQALVNGDWSAFSDETVKMLMNIFDVDRSGAIGFNEFVGLWQYVKDWQGVFRQFDRDNSGAMDGPEFKTALSQFGYTLSPQLIDMLQKKYSPLQGNPGAPRGITFDRFVRCCVAVKQLSEGFKRHDADDRDGWITIGYEQFMQLVLSAP
ncbi:hypothetical protein JCM11641_003008 [Rhodosporidiobolus odoratus]